MHWYCQNWVGDHPKVTWLPISQDYHTMQTGTSWGPLSTALDQERSLFRIRADYGHFSQRRVRCYANFHFRIEGAKYGQDRKDAIARVPKSVVFYEGSRVSRFRTWENQAHYAFVLSPHGNGLDCHRTWEALAVGSIPIVKTSAIDPVYQGLPVLIVQDWADVTARLLNETVQRFSQIDWDYHRLTLAYWVKKIRASGNLTLA